jgi:hypothetical protein
MTLFVTDVSQCLYLTTKAARNSITYDMLAHEMVNVAAREVKIRSDSWKPFAKYIQ